MAALVKMLLGAIDARLAYHLHVHHTSKTNDTKENTQKFTCNGS